MRTSRWTSCVLSLTLFHCGDAPAASPAAPEAGAPNDAQALGIPVVASDAAFSAPPPASTNSAAASQDGGTDGCSAGAPDEPDDQGLDTNCDGADGVVGTDVYVDPLAGQDTNDGSPSEPVQSLAQAFAIAAPRSGHILVATGQYSTDSLPMTGTWSLYGGYTTAFVGAPNRANTVLVASASGLLVDSTTTSGRLVHVTVQGSASTDPTQLSVHALRSRAAKLALDDDALQAADASPGLGGTQGEPGAVGNPQGCNGAPYPAYALGQRYATAAPDGTAPGSIANGGTPAAVAGGGFAGTDGADAPAGIRLQNDFVAGATATPGNGDGDVGFGGAGGLYTTGWENTYLVWGGQGGNGGCPGGGGNPGPSGGSSVALLVLAGEVDVTRSALRAGFGGNGGDGGPGGFGGAGAFGSAPALVDPVPETGALGPTCTPSDDLLMLRCAEYGGQGGPGGLGGHGGGGAGGWSVGALLTPTGTYSIDDVTTVEPSRAGTGGLGNGGGHGPDGETHGVYTLPPQVASDD